MSADERISIVVTTWNARAWIDRALQSALTQTHADTEVIVVDDASTDGTADHVEQQYGARVLLLRNAGNRGPSASRNRGIDAATGAWFMQLDGDDWIAPERGAHLLQFARETASDIVADDQLLVLDGSDEPIGTNFIANGFARRAQVELTTAQFVRRDLGWLKPMIRLDLLRATGIRYPEHIRYGEDFLFLYALLQHGARFAVMPELTYYMRRGNTGSLTTQRDPLFAQVIAGTRALLADAHAQQQHDIAAALTTRIQHLEQLQRGERAIASLRARRLPRPGDLPAVAQKILSKISSQLRLALLLQEQGQEIRRQLASQ